MAPLSVSGILRTALFDRGPVVVTSATLTVGGAIFQILLLVVIVLGGILRGLFTATEAAAIAVLYALPTF